MSIIPRGRTDLTAVKPRKYNDPQSLDELCRSFLQCQEDDKGAALEYCKGFLTVLSKKDLIRGAVLSSRAKSR
jgi:hypothetical protein